jgi:hypothetical protein
MKRLFGRSASPIAVVVAVVAFLVTGCGSGGGVGSGPPASASLAPTPTTSPPDATATTQPTPTATLMALHDDALAAGRYVATPFTPPNMWAFDVDGVLVVIQTGDFAGTSAHDRVELKAIVDSIRIEH